ncbi:uncharacterized protein LOC131954240 isoform X2 [Physella acuta]|uniref:uncharacterized protein LOC131954240 isoform X2 n=1 Tax=Physella acuta TaxID=109671 RepID=UPI0027DB6794|nr:uncharacterized protein LOC131954240 isoform X2 [Physella acuta]
MLLSRLHKWLSSQKRKRKYPVEELGSRCSQEKMSNLSKQLERLPTMFVKDCGYIPVVLTNAASIIEKNLKVKDLFQTQGVAARVNQTISQLNATRVSRVKNATVHDVIEAMKTFLVHLPEPLLPENVCDSLITACCDDVKYSAVLAEFHRVSPHNFAIVLFMMRLLKKVSQHADQNSMDVRKLATIFVLDVINPMKLEDPSHGAYLVERMQKLPYLIMVVENLISNVETVVSHIKGASSPSRGSGLQTPVLNTQSVESEHGETLEAGSASIRQVGSASIRQVGSASIRQVASASIRQVAHDDMKLEHWSTKYKPCRVASDSSDVRHTSGSERRATSPARQSAEKPSNTSHQRFKSPAARKKPLTQTAASLTPNQSYVMKPPRSADQKMIVKTKTSHGPSSKAKKKRKNRAAKKKLKCESSVRCNSRESDYTTFQPEEEITPWTDGATNSDDTSLMAKTIRNPRVLLVEKKDDVTRTQSTCFKSQSPTESLKRAKRGVLEIKGVVISTKVTKEKQIVSNVTDVTLSELRRPHVRPNHETQCTDATSGNDNSNPYHQKSSTGQQTSPVEFKAAPADESRRLSHSASLTPSQDGSSVCSHKDPSQKVKVTVRANRSCRPQLVNRAVDVQVQESESRNTLSEWLVDIFLVSLTLLCTCLVFYCHQSNRPLDGWITN